MVVATSTKQKNIKKKSSVGRKKPSKQKASVLRALKHKEPKLVENVKQLLVMRGNKTNETIKQLLTDLRMLKSPDSKMLSKKNDIHVFENDTQIEFLTQKNDTSLFMVGSNTKKRPNNLVIGRTFDGHILDVLELGVENFKSLKDIKCKSKKAPGSKPCFVFQGDIWETCELHMKLKNLFIDMFRGVIVSEVNLRGLDHAIVCSTGPNNRVLFRTYSIDFIKSNDAKHPRVELDLMGPCMDLSFRRTKFASPDLMKVACKKPKGLEPKKQKNVKRDSLTGDKVGRVYMTKQDLETMQVRRVKALRKTPAELKNNLKEEPVSSTDE